MLTFKVEPEYKIHLKKLIGKTPHISSMAQLFRESIRTFSDRLDQGDYAAKKNSEFNQVKDLIHDLTEKMGVDHSTIVSTLISIKDLQHTQRKDELETYLEYITESLFVNNLDRVLQIKTPGQLIPFLQEKYLADYLPAWLDLMERDEFVRFVKNKLIWNVIKIKEVYS